MSWIEAPPCWLYGRVYMSVLIVPRSEVLLALSCMANPRGHGAVDGGLGRWMLMRTCDLSVRSRALLQRLFPIHTTLLPLCAC